MKLFNHKSKGKDYYNFFDTFDRKAKAEFGRYVEICTGQTLDYLNNTNAKLSLTLPLAIQKDREYTVLLFQSAIVS